MTLIELFRRALPRQSDQLLTLSLEDLNRLLSFPSLLPCSRFDFVRVLSFQLPREQQLLQVV